MRVRCRAEYSRDLVGKQLGGLSPQPGTRLAIISIYSRQFFEASEIGKHLRTCKSFCLLPPRPGAEYCTLAPSPCLLSPQHSQRPFSVHTPTLLACFPRIFSINAKLFIPAQRPLRICHPCPYSVTLCHQKKISRHAWVAQSVKLPSGSWFWPQVMVSQVSQPCTGLHTGSAKFSGICLGFFSPPLSLLISLSLSPCRNKINK